SDSTAMRPNVAAMNRATAVRRLVFESWDSGGVPPVPRSASVDRLVMTSWAETAGYPDQASARRGRTLSGWRLFGQAAPQPVQDDVKSLHPVGRMPPPGQLVALLGEPDHLHVALQEAKGDEELLPLFDGAPEVVLRVQDQHRRGDVG